MQNLTRNPDGRPLPDGWSQHFEPSKRTWYYVQMNIMPPKVSFTHPADLTGNGGVMHTSTSQQPMNAHQQAVHRAQSMSGFPVAMATDNSRSGGLTFAQKLYASSASNTHAHPMLNPTDIHQNASKPQLPSPPPSSRGASPLPISPADFHPAAIPRPNASRMASMPNFSHSAMLPVSGGTSSAPPLPPHPTRSTTFAAAQAFGQPHRIVTQHTKPGFPPPRQTPHIVTTARPPTSPTNSSHHPVLSHSGHSGGAPSINSNNSHHSTMGSSPSPPSTSVLFSKPQPPPPPPLSTQQPFGSMSPPPQINSPTSTISTITPDNAHLHRPSANSIHNNMVSMANTYSTGPSPLGGGGPSFEARLVPSLRFALNGTRVTEAEIQGVIQGQVDANYQGVVNALKQKQLGQQLQSNTPQVDYPALVVETQRLQIRAQSQQAETLLAQQSNLQAQAYAQLQAQQEAQAQALADRLQQEEMARLQQQQQLAAMQQQAQQALQAQQQQQQQILAQQNQALQQQQQQQQQMIAQQTQALQQQQQALAQQQQAQQQAMYDSFLQQQQQQPQQYSQQQQQQQNPLSTFLDVYNQFQQQQGSNTTTSQPPPSFDALYGTSGGGDPTGGSANFMESLTQTMNTSITSMGGGGGDPSAGLSGFLGGLNNTLASTDTSGLTSGLGSAFDMGSLGDSLGSFATE